MIADVDTPHADIAEIRPITQSFSLAPCANFSAWSELRGEAAGSGTGGTSKSGLTALTGTGKAKMSDAAQPGCLVPNANEHNGECNALPGAKRHYNQKLVDYCRKLNADFYLEDAFGQNSGRKSQSSVLVITATWSPGRILGRFGFFKRVIDEIRHWCWTRQSGLQCLFCSRSYSKLTRSCLFGRGG